MTSLFLNGFMVVTPRPMSGFVTQMIPSHVFVSSRGKQSYCQPSLFETLVLYSKLGMKDAPRGFCALFPPDNPIKLYGAWIYFCRLTMTPLCTCRMHCQSNWYSPFRDLILHETHRQRLQPVCGSVQSLASAFV